MMEDQRKREEQEQRIKKEVAGLDFRGNQNVRKVVDHNEKPPYSKRNLREVINEEEEKQEHRQAKKDHHKGSLNKESREFVPKEDRPPRDQEHREHRGGRHNGGKRGYNDYPVGGKQQYREKAPREEGDITHKDKERKPKKKFGNEKPPEQTGLFRQKTAELNGIQQKSNKNINASKNRFAAMAEFD